jgi:hypothetical protein
LILFLIISLPSAMSMVLGKLSRFAKCHDHGPRQIIQICRVPLRRRWCSVASISR